MGLSSVLAVRYLGSLKLGYILRDVLHHCNFCTFLVKCKLKFNILDLEHPWPKTSLASNILGLKHSWPWPGRYQARRNVFVSGGTNLYEPYTIVYS